ncbi:unnamed protein product [Rhodiola kirilowii]
MFPSSMGRWGCQITDEEWSRYPCKMHPNLTFISLWGMAGITDAGVIQLISRASSLRHLNIGGTFITDESLYAIAHNCPNLTSIVLWSCRHITESGLLALVNSMPQTESNQPLGDKSPS